MVSFCMVSFCMVSFCVMFCMSSNYVLRFCMVLFCKMFLQDVLHEVVLRSVCSAEIVERRGCKIVRSCLCTAQRDTKGACCNTAVPAVLYSAG